MISDFRFSIFDSNFQIHFPMSDFKFNTSNFPIFLGPLDPSGIQCKGNRYRLIAAIHYQWGMVYVLRFLTHAQYDKDQWKGEL